MSDYRHEKVLRYPIDSYDLDQIEENISLKILNKFQLAPTEDLYLDYVLQSDYDESGDWGKFRDLYDSEKNRYYPIFKEVIPDVNMDNVKLVEYCWYDCSEAPSYYNEFDDNFYNEV